MSRIKVTELPLKGLRLLTLDPIGDSRGSLTRLFCANLLAEAGWTDAISQVNCTVTRRRGTVRGMHFQMPPHAEDKLVYCMQGEIWDVAVDLRCGSDSLLKWHGETLSRQGANAMWIPKGFAHGFQAMSDNVELLYMHSASYQPSHERGLNATDPQLAIAWPLEVIGRSPRDEGFEPIQPNFPGCLF